jgi:hypothetical protein
VRFQAGESTYYQQTVMPLSTPEGGDDLSQLITVDGYPQAGSTKVVDFAHGPVGPGFRGRVPRGDHVQRIRGRLFGQVPGFSGSGGPTGYADRRSSSWTLRSGSELLAQGRGDVRLRTPVPAGERGYVLTATSQPDSPDWTLSTMVRDEWTFRFGGKRSAAVLLTPHYVPPVSLAGYLAPGPTAFPLAFRSLTRHEVPITRARVQLSTDDGRHWRDARLVRISPTRFTVAYRNPAAGPGRRFMPLRIVAEDAAGDRVVETAMRVYRLR